MPAIIPFDEVAKFIEAQPLQFNMLKYLLRHRQKSMEKLALETDYTLHK